MNLLSLRYFVIVGFLFVSSQSATAGSLFLFDRYLVVEKEAYEMSSENLQAWTRKQNELHGLREQAALEVWKAQRNTRLDWAQFENKLAQSKAPQMFQQAFEATALSESLRELGELGLPISKQILRLFQQSSKDQISLFQLVGHFQKPNRGPLKAGFHRGDRSIFMDLSKIPQNEWLLILSHELIHHLDRRLQLATIEFSSPANVRKISAWIKDGSLSQSKLPDESALEIKNHLRKWLEFGLDRGLLAEYRAWVPTVLLYQQGIKAGRWAKMNWMEELLAEKKNEEDIKKFMYRILRKKSSPPDWGPFSIPLIHRIYESILLPYDSGVETPSLYNLEEMARRL